MSVRMWDQEDQNVYVNQRLSALESEVQRLGQAIEDIRQALSETTTTPAP